jgi:hypothetical protein
MRSFLDHGHGFDLYTFDSSIIVPPGVRVCDASDLISAENLFVYDTEYGKGSPAAFTNLFRYKLLVEKGGWWVDTDVVCLSEEIPTFREFFAWQAPDRINGAILFFEPSHPLMVRCLEDAMKMGSQITWGKAGPLLLTRVLQEFGYAHRALPSSVCYPVPWQEALDTLRPSESARLSERTESSIFVHLWNSILQRNGVQKSNLPPERSMLRRWVDQHPVDGWSGQYDAETIEHLHALHARAMEIDELTEEIRNLKAELSSLRGLARALLKRTRRMLPF